MLLSTCPQCAAQFKVAPEQLSVRQGRVMCGRCRHVFNAFESLKRIEDVDTAEIVDYAVVDSGRSAVAELDDGHTTAIADAPVGADIAEAAMESAAGLLADAATVLTGDTTTEAPPTTAAAQLDSQNGGASFESATATLPDDEPVPIEANQATAADDNNSKASGNPLISGPMPMPPGTGNRHWGVPAALAGILLCLQALYFFRSPLVQQYPQLRPHLVAACDIAGCTIPWGRDHGAIKIESSDLIEPPGKPGRILLTAIIANRAGTGHDFPYLEVKLTDAGNVVLASRVLSPGEYLGRVPSREEYIAANAELYVNLNLELTGKAPASGYGLRAFYP